MPYYLSDGTVGGKCEANTSSGCLDPHAVCVQAVCTCVQGYFDIDGVCKAGQLFT